MPPGGDIDRISLLDAAHHGIGSASCGPPLPPGHSLAARTVTSALRFSA
jgi:hypothetical protein